MKRSLEKGLIEVNLVDFRNFAEDKHKRVDDRPFGGGPGMLLKADPIIKAVESLLEKHSNAKVILLSPQGQQYSQLLADEYARLEDIILICGRYEGFDERIFEILNPIELSIGDFVLTGGEVPAMVIMDSVMRLIPSALGCDESNKEDSFATGILDYPQYTRPVEYRGLKVPDVLLSGNHQYIETWRKEKAMQKTKKVRQDLLIKKEEQ